MEAFLVNLQKNSVSNGTKFAFARILSRFEILLVDYFLKREFCPVHRYNSLLHCSVHNFMLYVPFVEKNYVMVYLEDAIEQLLEHKDDVGKVNVSRFFAT